jgi:prophage tail gpP-like protein
MKPILVVALTLFASAYAHADTTNVKKGQSQLHFRKAETSASGGATASRPPVYSEKQAMFRQLDIDGDGFVSKAEAAGNATATLGFDRADRNRDGKLSFSEYDSIGKAPAAAKKKQQARTASSASAGSTKEKAKAKAD